MRSRWFAGCIAAGLLLSACSGNSDGGIQPIPEDGASTEAPDEVEDDTPDDPEPDDEPDDPFALPDEINQAYVQLVADEIMAINTQAIRVAVEENLAADEPSIEEATLLMASAHTGPSLLEATELIPNIVRGSNIEDAFLPPQEFDDEQLNVLEVIVADDSCITFTGRFDRSGTLREPPSDPPYFAITLSRDEDDELANDTSWKMREAVDIIVTDTGDPATREQVEGIDFEVVETIVDTTCGGDA